MKTFVGFDQALALALSAVTQCGVETIPLSSAIGKYLAADVFSIVDSPSLSTSRKEGYAVISSDLAAASHEAPVQLIVAGASYAGKSLADLRVEAGQAVQVTTGAPIPLAADAVISEEYTRRLKFYQAKALRESDAEVPKRPREYGGPRGKEPTRYGDWEKNGRCIDF